MSCVYNLSENKKGIVPMHKNYYWIIELIIIIAIFSFNQQGMFLIGADNFYYLISGLIMNTIMCVGFLIFAMCKLKTSSNNHSCSFFKKDDLFKDILLVLLLLILQGLTYGIIMEIKFVHVFNVPTSSHNLQLTTWQLLFILFLYAIFVPAGVFAEELYFRCYLFENQYDKFKNYTWVINGISWSIYHIFTPTNFVALLPTCLIYSYVYQKRRNIWITITAHLINNSIAFYPAIRTYVLQL